MELTPAKIAMVLVALLAIGGGGAWAWASATMHGRLADVRNESRQIGYGRGGRLPSEAQVREQVELIAAMHEVSLEGLEVSMHEEEGLGGIAARVPQLGESLTGRLRVYDIRAYASTHALGFTLTEPLGVTLQLRASVSARVPGRPEVRVPGSGVSSPSLGTGVGTGDIDVQSERGMHR